MPSDPFIEPAQWLRIGEEIDAIERQYNVRVLLAVESGSRAWRFPSPDSDYDVRFIYARPREAYLAIEMPPDVIERPIDPVLDISGWDMRKALQLLVRSNAVLIEWLTSPIRYRSDSTIVSQFLALARGTYYLPAVAYHYDRMARRSFDDVKTSVEGPRLKSYCYALRPVLALLWMRRHGTLPPMDLPGLRQGLTLDRGISQTIDKLVDLKSASDERGTTPRLPALDEFIEAALKVPIGRFSLPDRTDVTTRATELFLSIARQMP
jgi:predicted nucleotidyltransferase